MSRIFISYKRVDKEKVFRIKDQIESALGEKCWIDLDGIESDAVFASKIIGAINNCEVFLFMYSNAHTRISDYDTDWTIREINFAQEKKKRIVFINIDSSTLTDWFRLIFGTKQQVDGTNSEELCKLIKEISKWTNKIVTTNNIEKKEAVGWTAIYKYLKKVGELITMFPYTLFKYYQKIEFLFLLLSCFLLVGSGIYSKLIITYPILWVIWRLCINRRYQEKNQTGVFESICFTFYLVFVSLINHNSMLSVLSKRLLVAPAVCMAALLGGEKRMYIQNSIENYNIGTKLLVFIIVILPIIIELVKCLIYKYKPTFSPKLLLKGLCKEVRNNKIYSIISIIIIASYIPLFFENIKNIWIWTPLFYIFFIKAIYSYSGKEITKVEIAISAICGMVCFHVTKSYDVAFYISYTLLVCISVWLCIRMLIKKIKISNIIFSLFVSIIVFPCFFAGYNKLACPESRNQYQVPGLRNETMVMVTKEYKLGLRDRYGYILDPQYDNIYHIGYNGIISLRKDKLYGLYNSLDKSFLIPLECDTLTMISERIYKYSISNPDNLNGIPRKGYWYDYRLIEFYNLSDSVPFFKYGKGYVSDTYYSESIFEHSREIYYESLFKENRQIDSVTIAEE